MRQKTLISAFILSVFFVVSFGISGVHAGDIFIKKNKGMPMDEGSRTHVFTPPKISSSPAQTPGQPSVQVEPRAIPQYMEQQQPVAPLSPPQMQAQIDKPACTRQDAEKIIKFDREFFKNLGDLETQWVNFEDPNSITALTDLYVRCGRYLHEYKTARGEETEVPKHIVIKPLSDE